MSNLKNYHLQSWVNSTTMTAAGQTLTDKARIKAVTPGGFAWNGFLTQTLIGSGGLTYDAATSAYAALTAPQKAAWETATDDIVPVISDAPCFCRFVLALTGR